MFPFSNTLYFVFTFAEYFDIRILWLWGRTKNGEKFIASFNKYLLYSALWHELCLGKQKWMRQAWLPPLGILQSTETNKKTCKSEESTDGGRNETESET